MIVVEYLPSVSDEQTARMLGDNDRIKQFATHDEFKSWITNWICGLCKSGTEQYREPDGSLEFAEEFYRPKTVRDCCGTPCACEIDIEDEQNIIKWDDPVEWD